MTASYLTLRQRRHVKRVQIVDDAFSGIIPGVACRQDSQGRWLVDIGSIGFYVNGIAEVIVDALEAEELT